MFIINICIYSRFVKYKRQKVIYFLRLTCSRNGSGCTYINKHLKLILAHGITY